MRSALHALLVLVLCSCSASQKTAEHTALVCAESALAKDAVPAVERALTTGSWEALLTAFAVGLGGDVLNCAVKLARADLAGVPSTASGSGTSEAIARADQWLKAHGK